MIEQLAANAERTQIIHFGMRHAQQGIMHVVGHRPWPGAAEHADPGG